MMKHYLAIKNWWKKKKRLCRMWKVRGKLMKEAASTHPAMSMEEEAELNEKSCQFNLSREDWLKIIQWQRSHKCIYPRFYDQLYWGCCGGFYEFSFLPTITGTMVTVTCACGAELKLNQCKGKGHE